MGALTVPSRLLFLICLKKQKPGKRWVLSGVGKATGISVISGMRFGEGLEHTRRETDGFSVELCGYSSSKKPQRL